MDGTGQPACPGCGAPCKSVQDNRHHHLTFKPFFTLIWILLHRRLGNVLLARCYISQWAYEWVTQPGCGCVIGGRLPCVSFLGQKWVLVSVSVTHHEPWTMALGTCVRGTFLEAPGEGPLCPPDRALFCKEFFRRVGLSAIGRQKTFPEKLKWSDLL